MSGITTGTALAIGLGTSAATAGIGAIASTSAANTQAGAAESAAQLQAQEAQNALNFQQQEWTQNQANEAPFLNAGKGAVTTLSSLINTPGQGLLQPWTGEFQAPTAAQAEATPGYQFQLQQGEQALQRSAAAQGGLLSGGTAKALNNYAQGTASANYQQVYNNALQQYQQSYNQFQNNQANTYNRLANVAGFGQTTAGQLGQQGQAAASNTGNIFLTAGQQQAQDIQNAAAATASGYVGGANALSGGANSVGQYALLQSLLNGTGGGSAFDPNLGFQPGAPTAVPGNGSGLIGVVP